MNRESKFNKIRHEPVELLHNQVEKEIRKMNREEEIIEVGFEGKIFKVPKSYVNKIIQETEARLRGEMLKEGKCRADVIAKTKARILKIIKNIKPKCSFLSNFSKEVNCLFLQELTKKIKNG